MTANSSILIERDVDRMFHELNAVRGDYCTNPVTGGHFIWGVDPISVQRKQAVRKLLARERFAASGPSDAPPLPLSDIDVEDYRRARGLAGVVGFYARSLSMRDDDMGKHPPFDDFARGLMASDTGWWRIEKDAELKRRFPPRPLAGMTPGLYWAPPKEYEETMASYRRATARVAA